MTAADNPVTLRHRFNTEASATNIHPIFRTKNYQQIQLQCNIMYASYEVLGYSKTGTWWFPTICNTHKPTNNPRINNTLISTYTFSYTEFEGEEQPLFTFPHLLLTSYKLTENFHLVMALCYFLPSRCSSSLNKPPIPTRCNNTPTHRR